MKKLIFILLLMVPTLGFGDEALDQFMARLQSTYENLNSIRANFQQSYQSKRFSEKMTENGIVYFSKGGLMKWEYTRPERKIFVCDGDFYYYYVPADKQVVKIPAENPSRYSPALFLAGKGNFLRDFHSEWADPRPDMYLVKLVPVEAQLDFEYLLIEVDSLRSLIRRLTAVDEYGNRTEFLFNEIQENPNLPAGFFKFVPPDGTDVIFQARNEPQG